MIAWWKRRREEKKKKIKYSKFIVFLVIMLNTVFAFTTLYVFKSTSSEPTSLILAWFGFTTGELFLLAGIKKKEVEKEVDNNDGSPYV